MAKSFKPAQIKETYLKDRIKGSYKLLADTFRFDKPDFN